MCGMLVAPLSSPRVCFDALAATARLRAAAGLRGTAAVHARALSTAIVPAAAAGAAAAAEVLSLSVSSLPVRSRWPLLPVLPPLRCHHRSPSSPLPLHAPLLLSYYRWRRCCSAAANARVPPATHAVAAPAAGTATAVVIANERVGGSKQKRKSRRANRTARVKHENAVPHSAFHPSCPPPAPGMSSAVAPRLCRWGNRSWTRRSAHLPTCDFPTFSLACLAPNVKEV